MYTNMLYRNNILLKINREAYLVKIGNIIITLINLAMNMCKKINNVKYFPLYTLCCVTVIMVVSILNILSTQIFTIYLWLYNKIMYWCIELDWND